MGGPDLAKEARAGIMTLAVLGIIAAEALAGRWAFRATAGWLILVGAAIGVALVLGEQAHLVPLSERQALVVCGLSLIWIDLYAAQITWKGRRRWPRQLTVTRWIVVAGLSTLSIMFLAVGLRHG